MLNFNVYIKLFRLQMYRVIYMYNILILTYAHAKVIVLIIILFCKVRVLCHPEWCHIHYVIKDDLEFLVLLLLLPKHWAYRLVPPTMDCKCHCTLVKENEHSGNSVLSFHCESLQSNLGHQDCMISTFTF